MKKEIPDNDTAFLQEGRTEGKVTQSPGAGPLGVSSGGGTPDGEDGTSVLISALADARELCYETAG